jgi:hypothetical protein
MIDWVRTSQLIALIVIGLGAILGATGKITVFRDRNDIFTTFSLVISGGFALVYLYPMADKLLPYLQAIARVGVVLLAIAGILIVFARSWVDNRGAFSTLLAVLTKLPFAILVPVLILQAAAPTGKKASQRAFARFIALGGLILLAPLVVALTRDKTGLQGLYRYR